MSRNELIQLMLTARESGVLITVRENNIVFKAKNGVNIDPKLIQELKENKESIRIFLVKEQNNISKKNEGIKRINLEEIEFPLLSFPQESAWIEGKMKGDFINLATEVIDIRGKLNIEAIRNALNTIALRHESFRTIIKEDQDTSIPFQEIRPAEEWKMIYHDQSAAHFDIDAYLGKYRNIKFDYSKDFSYQVEIIKISEDHHLAVLVVNHIAGDAHSFNIFLSELGELYNSFVENRTPQLNDLPLRYIDYAYNQREFMKTPEFEKQVHFWEENLKGIQILKLPVDFKESENINHDAETQFFEFNKEEYINLDEFVKKNGISYYIFFLSIAKIILHKFTGVDDICIGTPVGNRKQIELERIIGYFANNIPIRTFLKNSYTYQEFLETVKSNVYNCFENQDVPIEKLSGIVSGNKKINPLTQIVLNFLDTSNDVSLVFKDLEIEKNQNHMIAYNQSSFDLMFGIFKANDYISLLIKGRKSFFDLETIKSMGNTMMEVVKQVIANPSLRIGDLHLVKEKDLEIMQNFNDSGKLFPGSSFLDLFEQQVHKSPDSIAVEFNDIKLSYTEFNDKINQVANSLTDKGVKKNDKVPIILNRGAEMLITMLGILKTGASYVGIPKETPIDRLKYILSDINPELVIYDENCILEIPSQHLFLSVQGLMNELEGYSNRYEYSIDPESLAYIVYTSGSTGNPKAVCIRHNSLLNFLCSSNEIIEINSDSAFIALFPYSFDGACLELFSPLMVGGKTVIVSDKDKEDAFKIVSILENNNITHICMTPSGFLMLLNAGWEKRENIQMISTGEKLKSELIQELLVDDRQYIINYYGPTEITLCATYKKLYKDSFITVGKPFHNYSVYILENDNSRCPAYFVGEVSVGGIGLAEGYLNQEQLTKEKFIYSEELSGKRLYKTGDLGRILPNGELQVFGRKDDQVKLRGFRIELGEIEHVINSIDEVGESKVVLINKDSEELQKIIAYVVLKSEISSNEIEKRIGKTLPYYMIPSAIVILESFPLMTNGKKDINALKKMDIYVNETVEENVIQTPIINHTQLSQAEIELCSIWKEIIQADSILPEDDFFELGGNSLLSVRLVSNIKKKMNIDFPINTVFTFPTLRKMSQKINELLSENEETQANLEKLILPINEKAHDTALFFAPAVGGNPIEYNMISQQLGDEYSFYGFFSRGLDGKIPPYNSVQEAASDYIRLLKKYDYKKISLGGYSFGGVTAFEMHYKLEQENRNLGPLFILDGPSPMKISQVPRVDHSKLSYSEWIKFFYDLYARDHSIEDDISPKINSEILNKLSDEDKLLLLQDEIKQKGADIDYHTLKGYTDVYIKNSLMKYFAEGKKINTPIILIKCTVEHQSLLKKDIKSETIDNEDYGWSAVTSDQVYIHEMNCTHLELLKEPYVNKVASVLKEYLS